MSHQGGFLIKAGFVTWTRESVLEDMRFAIEMIIDGGGESRIGQEAWFEVLETQNNNDSVQKHAIVEQRLPRVLVDLRDKPGRSVEEGGFLFWTCL